MSVGGAHAGIFDWLAEIAYRPSQFERALSATNLVGESPTWRKVIGQSQLNHVFLDPQVTWKKSPLSFILMGPEFSGPIFHQLWNSPNSRVLADTTTQPHRTKPKPYPLFYFFTFFFYKEIKQITKTNLTIFS